VGWRSERKLQQYGCGLLPNPPTAEQWAWLTNLNALKRVGRPQDIARPAPYLATEDGAFVSGTAHLVDGGLSVTRT
jgi:NAD(P)-dependent dehydrogenase (short-subunit alcohol dehydrogenase family)